MIFGFAPAIIAGLIDSVNPCALAVWLLFVEYLLRFAKNSRSAYLIGFGFIFTLILTSLFINLGIFDEVLFLRWIQDILKVVYGLISILFIVVGVVNFRDWLGYKKTLNLNQFLIKQPRILFQEENSNISFILKYFLLSLFLGFGGGILESVWPPHANVTFLYLNFSVKGQEPLAILILGIYSLFLALPIVLTCMFYGWFISRLNWREKFLKKIALFKIFSSAVPSGLGLGLLYLFYFKL